MGSRGQDRHNRNKGERWNYEQLSLFAPLALPRTDMAPFIGQPRTPSQSSSLSWPTLPSRTQVVPCARKTARAQVVGEAIVIHIPRDWPEREARRAARSLKLRVLNKLRQPALKALVESINSETVNVPLTDVLFSHRQNRSRIGSINVHTGIMRLSHRVAEAPPHVMRYLIVHELVHLLHANHGREFWAEVARHVPDYKVLRKRLQDVFVARKPRR